MEKYDVVNELYKLLIEQMKRAGLPVTLLCAALWAQDKLRHEQKNEYKEALQLYRLETGLEIKQLKTQLEVCSEQRVKAYQDLARMQGQIDYLTAELNRRK